MLTHTPPLILKNADGPAQVALIGRISTVNQDINNIPASYKYAEKFLEQVHKGEANVLTFGEQASGMVPHRTTIQAAEAWIRSGKVDLVMAEDVGRIYRNTRFLLEFIQNCVDQDTRVICPADNFDTADEAWEMMLAIACFRHGLAVPDARRRVRRTATYAFDHGGMVLKNRYGYRKLTQEEADSGRFGPIGLRIAKVAECTPIIQQICARFLRGASYVAIAKWLNGERIAPGPYADQNQGWRGRLVRDLLSDPILSGQRRFRTNMHKLIFETGKHKAHSNPVGPEIKQYAELAHLTPEEHAAVLKGVSTRKHNSAAGQAKGSDSALWNRPRARSLWPGQHVHCSICGDLMYRCGNYLKCKNALPNGTGTCWNHVQVPYTLLTEKVLGWMWSVLESFPSFRTTVIEFAWKEFECQHRDNDRSSIVQVERITELTHQQSNLAKAIAIGGNLEALVNELANTEKALGEAKQAKLALENPRGIKGKFVSQAAVAEHLDEALKQLSLTSLDFADWLRRLIPKFVICPVHAQDSPLIRPRAKLTLCMDAWNDGGETPPPVSVTLDLFEPPVHIRHMDACLALRQADPKISLKKIAVRLQINYMTVKRSFDFARKMENAGANDPYQEVLERPLHASRWKKRQKQGSKMEGS